MAVLTRSACPRSRRRK